MDDFTKLSYKLMAAIEDNIESIFNGYLEYSTPEKLEQVKNYMNYVFDDFAIMNQKGWNNG
jgi:hypothetical protein